MRPVTLRALALAALTALAACSGGAGTVPRAGSAAAPLAAAKSTLTFKRLASSTASAAARRTREFSAAANALVIDATQSGTSVFHSVIDISGASLDSSIACTSDVSGIYETCTVSVLMPVGSNTVTIATNAARDGSGATLGSATVPFTVVDQQNNTLSVTLDGVAASMRLAVSDPQPASGTSPTLALTAQLYDAAGFVFISPQTYVHPIVVTDGDTTAQSNLYTAAVQNSTQRYNGTPVASPAPSALAKTVSIPDRYTQAYVVLSAATAAFTITATYGSLTSSVTVTPSTAASRPAGTQQNVSTWPSSAPHPYDPIFDNAGRLWVTAGNGNILAIDPTTYQPTATYSLPSTSVRSLRSPAIGPDGAIYMSSGTISNGVTTAPWYVTRFDPVAHTFTDYPTTTSVYHLIALPSGLWATERDSQKLWQLPFTNSVAAAAPTEYAVAPPPVADSSPVLLPLPTRIFPSSDGNLWVVETSYAAVDGTWLAKFSPSGVKLSEALVDPQHLANELNAIGMTAAGSIWYINFQNLNEFVRQDNTTSGALTTFPVPRLYGDNTTSDVTAFAGLDGGGNVWFVSYLDSRIGRIDAVTGRVDFFQAQNGQLRGIAFGPTGTLVVAGWNGPSFLVTLNTQ